MNNPRRAELETIAITCGICHDQCVAACPVVESGCGLGAYPSRLAMLAWELSRETIPMDETVMAAMQQCIHCNACTTHCVYIDQPVDITPLVRWSRQRLIENGWATEAMRALAMRAEANNDPSGELQSQLKDLVDNYAAGDRAADYALLLVDATTLQMAPEMVKSALRLLSAYAKRDVLVSPYLDCGGSLYEYGYTAEARAWAERIAAEVERVNVREVITLTAANAHLLRQIYPVSLGITIPAKIFTIHEVLMHALEPGRLRRNEQDRVLLVRSMTEVYKYQASSPVEILNACCLVVNDPLPAYLFLRDLAYPDSPALDLAPDPRSKIMERILRYVEAMHATRIVTTEPSFLFDYQQQENLVPAVDLFRYVLESIN